MGVGPYTLVSHQKSYQGTTNASLSRKWENLDGKVSENEVEINSIYKNGKIVQYNKGSYSMNHHNSQHHADLGNKHHTSQKNLYNMNQGSSYWLE